MHIEQDSFHNLNFSNNQFYVPDILMTHEAPAVIDSSIIEIQYICAKKNFLP